MSVGRLVRDSEMTVIRTRGAFALVLPLLVLGIVISGIAFLFSDYIAPSANNKFEQLFRTVIFRKTFLKSIKMSFFKGTGDYYLRSVHQPYQWNYERRNGLQVNFSRVPDLITAKEAV